MKFLNAQYRNFKSNFFQQKSFIFKVEKPVGADVQSQKPSAQPAKKDAVPLNFDHHEKRFNDHILKLPKTVTDKVKQAFKTKLSEIKKRYQAEVDKLRGERHNSPEKVAAQKVHPEVNQLLDNIKKHISQVNKAPDKGPKTNAAKKESKESKDTLASNQKVTDIIVKQFNLSKYPYGKAKILQAIPKLNLTDIQKKQIANNRLRLNPKQKAIIAKEISVELKPHNPAEQKLLTEFFKKSSKLSKFFDQRVDKASILLSQEYNITKKGETLLLTKDKKTITISNPEDLLKDGVLPKNIQAEFKSIVDGKGSEKKLRSMLGKKIEANRQYMILKKTMLSKENIKRTGLMGKLTMLIQLWSQFTKALQGGNLNAFNDYFKAWKKSKGSPTRFAEQMRGAKGAYEKALNERKKTPKLSTLLKAYANPHGNEANNLFFHNMRQEGYSDRQISDSPLDNFRNQAKPAIKNYLGKRVGMQIGSIRMNRGLMELDGFNKDGKRLTVRIRMGEKGADSMATVVRYSRVPNKKGQMVDVPNRNVPKLKKVEVNKGTTILQQLSGVPIVNRSNNTVSFAPQATVAKKPKSSWSSDEIKAMVVKEKINGTDSVNLNKTISNFDKAAASLLQVKPSLKLDPTYKEVQRLVQLVKSESSFATTGLQEQLVAAYQNFMNKNGKQ